MIRTNYDPEADVLHVGFGPDSLAYDFVQEIAPGVFLECATDGTPIDVEIISASKRATAQQTDVQTAAA